jgi:hypothetical protein
LARDILSVSLIAILSRHARAWASPAAGSQTPGPIAIGHRPCRGGWRSGVSQVPHTRTLSAELGETRESIRAVAADFSITRSSRRIRA